MTSSLRLDPAAQLAHALRLARSGDTRGGLAAARAAYHILRERGDAALLRRARNTLASCQAAHGQFIEAIADALDAYQDARRAGDRLEAASALATISGASSFILETDDAGVRVLDLCLAEARALGSVALEARTLNLRAIRLGTMQRFDEAQRDFARALEMVDEADENTRPPMLAVNVAALSTKWLRAAPPDERETAAALARVRTTEAVDLARLEGNRAVEARAYYNFGDIAREMGEWQAALDMFQRSLAIEQSLGAHLQLVNLHMARAEVLEKLDRHDDADAAYLCAYEEAVLARPCRYAALAAAQLAAFCTRRGDAAGVAHWHDIFTHESQTFERESALARRQLEAFWRDMLPA